MTSLRKATIEILDQLTTLINDVGDCYTQKPDNGSPTIGRHVRHILDHFTALKIATVSGHLNYNNRNRDSIIETCSRSALKQIEDLVQWIKKADLTERSIEIESEVSVRRYQNIIIPGSLQREILYVINHTVHHIAYTRLVAEQMGITLADYLGIAPATATYLRTA